jgi:hypothetical protein
MLLEVCMCERNDLNISIPGIQLLERALLIGSDDQSLLTALYSQLGEWRDHLIVENIILNVAGNAYFALRNYDRAMIYHMSDLNASR